MRSGNVRLRERGHSLSQILAVVTRAGPCILRTPASFCRPSAITPLHSPSSATAPLSQPRGDLAGKFWRKRDGPGSRKSPPSRRIGSTLFLASLAITLPLSSTGSLLRHSPTPFSSFVGVTGEPIRLLPSRVIRRRRAANPAGGDGIFDVRDCLRCSLDPPVLSGG